MNQNEALKMFTALEKNILNVATKYQDLTGSLIAIENQFSIVVKLIEDADVISIELMQLLNEVFKKYITYLIAQIEQKRKKVNIYVHILKFTTQFERIKRIAVNKKSSDEVISLLNEMIAVNKKYAA